jgi:hypothetical protein
MHVISHAAGKAHKGLTGGAWQLCRCDPGAGVESAGDGSIRLRGPVRVRGAGRISGRTMSEDFRAIASYSPWS